MTAASGLPVVALAALLLLAAGCTNAKPTPSPRIEVALMEAGDSMIVNKLGLEEMGIKYKTLVVPWYRDPADGLVKANISAMSEADRAELLRIAPNANTVLNKWPTYQPIMWDRGNNLTLTNAYGNNLYLNNLFAKGMMPPTNKLKADERARVSQVLYTMEMQSTVWRDAIACYDQRTGNLTGVNRTESPATHNCTDDEWAELLLAAHVELEYINEVLADGWLAAVGKNFTLADVAMLPRLYIYQYYGVNFAKAWPAIKDYVDLHQTRPSVVSAIPARWFGTPLDALADVTAHKKLGFDYVVCCRWCDPRACSCCR